MEEQQILAALLGVAVGDALGVPVEFTSREERQAKPVREMRGWGTDNQPPGTWSDDTSLTLCTSEAIAKVLAEPNPLDTVSERLIPEIAHLFCRWYEHNLWTPHGSAFDIGGTTQVAITRLGQGVSPQLSGGKGEIENGNGSLMRILPIAFLHKRLSEPELLELACAASAITHAHPRSQIACAIYVASARYLLLDYPLKPAITKGWNQTGACLGEKFSQELISFSPLCPEKILQRVEPPESDGYVLHSLEAALWVLLHTDSYQEAVLRAVNLGGDTDTTAAIVGGLAGLNYGIGDERGIPKQWIEQIARHNEIRQLALNCIKVLS